MTPEEQRDLSKFLSKVLRHAPEAASLTLDAEGFAPVSAVLEAVRRRRRWKEVTRRDVEEVVAASDKQRFEIAGDAIRARYGHSVPQAVRYAEVEPPEVLYHGTSPEAVSAIRAEGLRPMRRQYVHLSTEVEQARLVGRRHHAHPVILKVAAREAWRVGAKFYQPEARLFLAEEVPPEFIGETEKATAGFERQATGDVSATES